MKFTAEVHIGGTTITFDEAKLVLVDREHELISPEGLHDFAQGIASFHVEAMKQLEAMVQQLSAAQAEKFLDLMSTVPVVK